MGTHNAAATWAAGWGRFSAAELGVAEHVALNLEASRLVPVSATAALKETGRVVACMVQL